MRATALSMVMAAGAGAWVEAQAQTTQLPGITVTTPSPVTPSAHGAPAKAQATPSQPVPDDTPPSLLISPDQGFASVTVMTPEQLLSQPSAMVGDALATRPGISATTFAPGASRPVIRGLSGFRVRIQENGVSTGDVSALSDDHAVPIDPLAAGQVEVVRGTCHVALRLASHRRCRQRRQQPNTHNHPDQRHPGRDARRVQHRG
jgi:iron complex outermembrane receptor protein